MTKTRWSAFVMIGSIFVILLFQGYWLHRLYKEEQSRTQQQTDVLFRDLVYKMQVQRFKADTLIYNAINASNVFGLEAANAIISATKKFYKTNSLDTIRERDLVLKKATDSILGIIQRKKAIDTNKRVFRISLDSLQIGGAKLNSIQIISDKRLDSLLLKDTVNGIDGRRNFPKQPLTITFHKQYNVSNEQPTVRIRKANNKLTNTTSSFSMVMRSKPIADSIGVKSLDSAFAKELKKINLAIKYHILTGKLDSASTLKEADSISFSTNIASVGLADPRYYKATFVGASNHIIKRILPQAFFSVVLTVLILLAFIFLYRNIVAAEKMAVIKNEFISNITHELKTPVATVQVAVEALKNFDGIKNPEKTKDYLDIATIELQRLGLLVDKVLRISMFQKQGFVLNKEKLNFQWLVEENLYTMKLQFEKYNAAVSFAYEEGDYTLEGDKLHLLSVVYNLVDNALKYSAANPVITLQLRKPTVDIIQFEVSDKGIGIPNAYLNKVFERFFRVPNKDRHDVKGYGLGLSYVKHIIEEHAGFITVKSKEGEGSTFTVSLPIKIKAS